MRHRALIVAGPTASGKSTLALALAQAFGGVVINADSMQVYRELRLLTARPTHEDERSAPHALYGVRPAAMPGSAAWWRDEAVSAMAQAQEQGVLPILCGGTGMYFAALTHGLSEIPDPGDAARAEARSLLAADGAAALHARLALVDPATAARLRPSDAQRVARAWEVLAGTGQGLAAWQSSGPQAGPWSFAGILLDPPRPALRQAISLRLHAMLSAGVLDEVRALLDLGLDPALPAMRAYGVAEFAQFLRGEATLEGARRRVELVTGQYVKRQTTWFRHRLMAEPHPMHTIHARFGPGEQFYDATLASVVRFVHDWVDARPRLT